MIHLSERHGISVSIEQGPLPYGRGSECVANTTRRAPFRAATLRERSLQIATANSLHLLSDGEKWVCHYGGHSEVAPLRRRNRIQSRSPVGGKKHKHEDVN